MNFDKFKCPYCIFYIDFQNIILYLIIANEEKQMTIIVWIQLLFKKNMLRDLVTRERFKEFQRTVQGNILHYSIYDTPMGRR